MASAPATAARNSSPPPSAPPPPSSGDTAAPAAPTPPSNSSSPSPPSNSSSSSNSSSPTPVSPPPPSPAPASPPPPSSSPPKVTPSSPPPAENPPPKISPSPPVPEASPAPTSGSASPAPPSNSGVSPPPPAKKPSTPTPIFSPPPPQASSHPPPPPSSSAVTLSPPPPHAATAAPRVSTPSSNASSDSRSVPPPPSSSSTTSSSSSSSNTPVIVGVSIAGVLIIAMIVICVTCLRKKRRRKSYMDHGRGPRGGDYMYNNMTQPWNTNPQNVDHIVKLSPPGPPQQGLMAMPPSPTMGLGINQSTFTYDELAAATGGFSQTNLLGQGGFGYVHKGVLPNGKEVAVKSLKSGSGQGEREFQAEVDIISRVHHRHLVSLVGYCIADGQRMLVYEFVPNNTLEFHLHGKGRPTMDWVTRLRIALGSAKGLAYLHEDCHPRIIHRDIKAANILLDHNFEAMVADFGLAKLTTDNLTHVSTRVMGTFGYLAPEYASSGKLTEKSDVFSFGVMLLELITGRKPVDPTSKIMEDSLVDWARPLLTRALEDGNYDELVDPHLENNFVPVEMARMVGCASASCRHSARRRPKMSQIVHALEGDSTLEDLNESAKPGQSSAYASTEGSYDTGAYNADMMKFRKMVMSSQDFESSEYGGTSEYGLNPSSSSSDSREMAGHSVQGTTARKL